MMDGSWMELKDTVTRTRLMPFNISRWKITERNWTGTKKFQEK